MGYKAYALKAATQPLRRLRRDSTEGTVENQYYRVVLDAAKAAR